MQPVPHFFPKIDLMVLYDDTVLSDDISELEMLLENIQSASDRTNKAMVKSEIALEINLIHVGPVSVGVEQARPHGCGGVVSV